jgi:hypothetical protein
VLENENERPHHKNERTFAGSEKSEVDLLTTTDDATLTTSDGDEGAKAGAPETRRAKVIEMMIIMFVERVRVEGSRLGMDESQHPLENR